MNNNYEIPIMFCFDNNYVIPAGVAFCSLLEHANKEYHYKFFVLHSDITEDNQKKLIDTIKPFEDIVEIVFIDMEHRFQDIWDSIVITGHFSKEVMYKVLVASIFPQYDKIITSDVDVVFLNDISESYISFNTDDDVYLAGTKMVGKMNWYMSNYEKDFTQEEIKKLSSFCGGYIIFNLKKIRLDNMESKFIECFKENGKRINQMEQDILNLCCYPKIKHLPLKYVTCSYLWDIYKEEEDFLTDENYSKEEILDAMENTIQLHYATSIKPWNKLDCTKSDVWFKYLVKTPFLNQFLANLQNNIQSNKDLIEKLEEEKNKYEKIAHIYLAIYNRLKNVINRINPKKIKEKKMPTVLVIDDMFPSKLSPFRYEEFMGYLDYFDNIFIASSGTSANFYDKSVDFEKIVEEFKKDHPEHMNKIVIYNDDVHDRALDIFAKSFENKIAVFTFINNVCLDNYKVLNYLEENDIPFIFTLYPGGGFCLNDKECNNKLRRVFSSKCFKKVIVTQQVTYDYLIKKKFCPEDKIEFIYGVVTPSEVLNKKLIKKDDNDIINICFVAYKYSKQGKDKGYDLYIEAAKKLLKKNKNLFFHVVGNFSEQDIECQELNGHIKFHGVMSSKDLKMLYKNMNIIVSPNRKSKLSRGTFDGFPTGACTEAMANRSCGSLHR